MSLVGDVIISFRELATDLPQTVAAPVISSVTPGGATGTLQSGTQYFLVATAETNFGETEASLEANVTLGGGDTAFTVNLSLNALVALQTVGVTAIRVYFGLATGQYAGYQRFSPVVTPPFIVTGPIAALNEPPTRSTAYLPDTDGAAVGAFAAYRWFNQALTAAAAKNGGGLPDFGAVPTVQGQPLYSLNGYWKKLDTAWYDGYPLYLARKNDVFRKNLVTGYVGAFLVYQASDRLIAECWPQPARTSGGGPLQSNITASATSAVMTSTGGWVLSFGLAQIGSEIVEYAALNGTTLTGLTRGMCGTKAVAHTAEETVTELNLMYSGYRIPSTIYAVGDSLTTFFLPPGWDEAIMSYMLYRFRSAEQDDKAAQRYLQEFGAKMLDLRTNRIIAGPRQISANAGRGAETMVGLGSPFGGVIVP